MGIAPSEFRAMTPSELFEAKESWVESQGGMSQRQRNKARADLARLKELYPDTPTQGSA